MTEDRKVSGQHFIYVCRDDTATETREHLSSESQNSSETDGLRQDYGIGASAATARTAWMKRESCEQDETVGSRKLRVQVWISGASVPQMTQGARLGG